MLKTDIKRRAFLKGCAATLGVMALGRAPFGNSIFEACAAGAPSVEWKPAFCGFCHYPCCATQVKVVNGVAMEIMGDKASESNMGRLCIRGLSAITQLYHPYRVKAPMKRTNPVKAVDNDPGWVEISWDEAFNTVADKLKEARAYNPRSVLYSNGFGVEESRRIMPYGAALGCTDWGSPGTLCPEHFNQLHLNGQMLDRIDLELCEYIVEIGRTMGSDWCATSGGHSAHYADTVEKGVKHVVVNPYCTHSAQRGEWVPIMPGTDTAFGLGLLHVMLHELNKYDEWFLKVRSNAPYLIDDKIVQIKGRAVHKGNYVFDEQGKALVWDEKLNRAVPHDSSKGLDYALLGEYEVNGNKYKTSLQVLKDFVQTYTPEWQEQYTTIPAAKVREIAADLIKYARIGSTIKIDDYTFPYRPAGIYMGRGMASHMLGVSAAKALGTVNLLLGNLDVPGGIQGMSNASFYKLFTDDHGVILPRGSMANQAAGRDFTYPPENPMMAEYYPMGHNCQPAAWEYMTNPGAVGVNYEFKMLIVHGADGMGSSVNNKITQKVLADIPFTVCLAYHYDLPTQFADVLLASNALLEADAIYRMFRNEKEINHFTIGLNGTLVREPVVSPVYNTMQGDNIWIELVDRCGLTAKMAEMADKANPLSTISPDYVDGLAPEYRLPRDRKPSIRDFIVAKIKSDFGPDGPALFKKCAFVPYRVAISKGYNYWHKPENTVRLPVYYQRMVANGELFKKQLAQHGMTVPGQDMEHVDSHYSGMPVWYVEGSNMMPTQEYPFKIVNWKVHYGVNNTGALYDNAYIHEIIDYSNPTVKRIHFPKSQAAKYGLKDGDRIRIETNYGGVTEGRVYLSPFIHPQCLGIPGNFGRRTRYMYPLKETGVYFNSLTTHKAETLNPISVSLESSLMAKIIKL